MVKQIFLSRALNQEQGILIGSQEAASTGPTYETAWQKLALSIYESSRQDPTFAAVLKESDVEIHTKTHDSFAEPTTSDSSSPSSAQPKAPVGP
jgi:hypothetical protein